MRLANPDLAADMFLANAWTATLKTLLGIRCVPFNWNWRHLLDRFNTMDLAKIFTFLLLGVHGLLAIWALVGFAEWFSPSVPWPRVSNVLFPRDVLFLQWLLTLLAASVFITGYALGWSYTPVAMACIYAAMAALCAVETFGYMESDTRFVAMAVEYVAYAGILVFLFRSGLFEPT